MFTPAEQTVKSSLKALGREFYIRYLQHAVFFRWQMIAGDTIAENVKPLRLERKILFVTIESEPWRTEFQFHKSALIKKINDAAECTLIEEMLISIGVPRPVPAPSNEETPFTPDEIIARDLPNVTLTDEEIDFVRSDSPPIHNEKLRAVMLDTSLARARLMKCRLQNGWHRCAKCEILVPPNDVFCDGCYRNELELFRRTIGEVIRDVPWLTFAEIYHEMEFRMPHMIDECRPETVSSVRATVVQQLARTIDVRNTNQVRRLVMIYRQVPPEQLSFDAIRKTMRRLRFDLPADDF